MRYYNLLQKGFRLYYLNLPQVKTSIISVIRIYIFVKLDV